MHPLSSYLHEIIAGARTWRGDARGKLSVDDNVREYQVLSSVRSSRTGYQFIASIWRSDGGVYPRRVYTRSLQASNMRSPLIERAYGSRWPDGILF